MNTKDKSIHQVITALMELEAKGCHSVFYEYGNSLFSVRIFKGEVKVENIVFERTINIVQEQPALEQIYNLIETLKKRVFTTNLQCYRQDFEKGVKSGKWEKVKPIFEVGENATSAMNIIGTGYFIDDPDNSLLYFVDMKQANETN
jgi:hypothetical protein